jgi:hypothetical protein
MKICRGRFFLSAMIKETKNLQMRSKFLIAHIILKRVKARWKRYFRAGCTDYAKCPQAEAGFFSECSERGESPF